MVMRRRRMTMLIMMMIGIDDEVDGVDVDLS